MYERGGRIHGRNVKVTSRPIALLLPVDDPLNVYDILTVLSSIMLDTLSIIVISLLGVGCGVHCVSAQHSNVVLMSRQQAYILIELLGGDIRKGVVKLDDIGQNGGGRSWSRQEEDELDIDGFHRQYHRYDVGRVDRWHTVRRSVVEAGTSMEVSRAQQLSFLVLSHQWSRCEEEHTHRMVSVRHQIYDTFLLYGDTYLLDEGTYHDGQSDVSVGWLTRVNQETMEQRGSTALYTSVGELIAAIRREDRQCVLQMMETRNLIRSDIEMRQCVEGTGVREQKFRLFGVSRLGVVQWVGWMRNTRVTLRHVMRVSTRSDSVSYLRYHVVLRARSRTSVMLGSSLRYTVCEEYLSTVRGMSHILDPEGIWSGVEKEVYDLDTPDDQEEFGKLGLLGVEMELVICVEECNVNPLFEENDKDVEMKSSSSFTLTSPKESEFEAYLEKDSIPPGIDLTLPPTLKVLSSNPNSPTLTGEKICSWKMSIFFSLVRFVWKIMKRNSIRKKIICLLATYLHQKLKPLSRPQEVEEIKGKEDKVSSDVPINTIVMPIRITFDNPIDFNDHFSKPKDLKKDLTVTFDSPKVRQSFITGILVYHAIHDKNLVTLEENLNENISSGTLLVFKESSFLLPPPKPLDECLNFKPNLVMKNLVLNEDLYQSKKTLPLNVEDVDSFTFIIWTFLPHFTYTEESPLIFSFRSENFVFDPDIITFHKPVACSLKIFHLLSLRTIKFRDRVELVTR
ncbi:hypothetical protein Tco_1314713 [Tanacetum coccineum]